MNYSLPDLTYDCSTLDPHLSARIIELHHSKHHKAYVDGANTTLDKLAAARDAGNFARFKAQMTQATIGVQGSGSALLSH